MLFANQQPPHHVAVPLCAIFPGIGWTATQEANSKRDTEETKEENNNTTAIALFLFLLFCRSQALARSPTHKHSHTHTHTRWLA